VEPGRVHTDRGTFEGRFLIGADGPASVFHRSFGIRVEAPPRRVGLSTHLTGFEAEPGTVEVVLIPGGEIYLAPVDRELTLVALLLDRRAAPPPGAVVPFLGRVLPERTAAAVAAGPVLAAAPLATRARRWSGPGWLLVGDAAGRIDPVSGQGMSVALSTAVLAADTVDRVLRGRGRESEYEARARAFRRPLERVTGWLLAASAHPALARRLLGRPRLLAPLIRVATGLDRDVSLVGMLLQAAR
jgi:flavin-dependent dehydrogenase